MKIKTDLRNITLKYEALRQEMPTSSNQDVIALLNVVANKLRSSSLLKSFPHVRVDPSIGQGNLPCSPTFYIKDERETTKGTRGVYIVLRVDTDKTMLNSGFLLALTQGREGVEDIKDPEKKEEQLLKFHSLAHLVAQEYFPVRVRKKHYGFQYMDDASFDDCITIVRKDYNHGDYLEKDFVFDLGFLLNAYRSYVDEQFLPGKEERSFALRIIERRLKQDRFQAQLWHKYSRCVVTGCDIRKIVDAAHIVPHSQEVNYSPTNGLLMRVDIHRLFDSKLLRIDRNGIVHLDKTVALNPCYSPYHKKDLGRVIDKKSLHILGRM